MVNRQQPTICINNNNVQWMEKKDEKQNVAQMRGVVPVRVQILRS
jgi:hypothetical protein